MTIKAVVENGMLKPLEELKLPDGTLVDAQLTPAVNGDRTQRIEEQRRAVDRLLKRLDAIPQKPSDDKFSARDHDAILYGWKDRR
ncbi:MAG TPA: antitoxin family protein [Planctomycetota bacterium]|nr:antitoxin family protein [Planctomycetota bacterium]